jgi:hypothetical protein
MMRTVRITERQAPGPDGIRRTKFAFVRDTYRNLVRTTLKSWFKWFPKDIGHFIGGGNGTPATHTIKFPHPSGDKSVCELIVEFIALDGANIEDVMSGWEGTGVYFDEMNLLSEDALDFAMQRVGRYPGGSGQACSWWGVWGSFNAPSVTSWIYKRLIAPIRAGTYEAAVTEKLNGTGIAVKDLLGKTHQRLAVYFRQPGAFEPGAENLHNLPGGLRYYGFQIATLKPHEADRKIHNKFGADRSGKPVYGDDWNDALHVAASALQPVAGVPLVIGADTSGITPAGVITQQLPNGLWRVYREIIPAQVMGAKAFGQLLNRTLRSEFEGFRWSGWGDPAGNARSGIDETKTWLSVLSEEMGQTWRAAPSNALVMRLEAVRAGLTALHEGQPGVLVDPRCETLIEGFNSGYRYRKMTTGGDDRYDDQPEKNRFSHVHDSFQYCLLGGGAHHDVMGRRERRLRGARPVVAQVNINPWGR